MSDYMFVLESHLSSGQSRVISQVQAAAAEAGVSVFLTGGALRDMIGGFPIRELDFSVEGNALKLAKTVASTTGAELGRVDDTRKIAHLLFPGAVPATIAMARTEKFPKPGAKPQVQPATIHEDLRGRDFTINSIALSLNPASRGLLIDPNNGAGDMANKELRTVTNYTLYDDPVRLLRLLRFRVRLGFEIGERTKNQYDNAREGKLEQRISPAALLEELRHIANEPNPADIVKVLEDEKLLDIYTPAFGAGKLNSAGLQKLQKARQLIPPGVDLHTENFGLFLAIAAEKLSPKEKQELIKNTGMEKEDIAEWQKLDPRAKKLESELKSAKLQKPSRIYQVLSKAPGEEIQFLLVRSTERVVPDRIRNYLQKYLPSAQEVTDREVTAAKGVEPGTPKFQKLKQEMIATKLDSRPKKVPPPPTPEELAAAAAAAPPPPAPPILARNAR